MKVRLTLENTASGVRATIREKDDAGEQSNTFVVETVKLAKQRASSIARKHGLDRYGVIDRTKRAGDQLASPPARLAAE
jgi:hypothetical protein